MSWQMAGETHRLLSFFYGRLLFRVQERGNFQHLLKNGMDFSSFLAQEQEEEVAEEADTMPAIRPEPRMARLRKRTDSVRSDNQSILSDHGSMKELPCTQSEVLDKEEVENSSEPVKSKEMQSTGSVSGGVYAAYFTAGTNWFAVTFMVVSLG